MKVWAGAALRLSTRLIRVKLNFKKTRIGGRKEKVESSSLLVTP